MSDVVNYALVLGLVALPLMALIFVLMRLLRYAFQNTALLLSLPI